MMLRFIFIGLFLVSGLLAGCGDKGEHGPPPGEGDRAVNPRPKAPDGAKAQEGSPTAPGKKPGNAPGKAPAKPKK